MFDESEKASAFVVCAVCSECGVVGNLWCSVCGEFSLLNGDDVWVFCLC